MIAKRNKELKKNEKKRSFSDRFQKRLTTLDGIDGTALEL